MLIHFGYEKKQVLQALRYHFITRKEIKFLLIVVNLFTIASAVLLYIHLIQPIAFLTFSILWFLLLITIWRILPLSIYQKNETFRDQFTMSITSSAIILRTRKGEHGWAWGDFSTFLESTYFFHLYFNSRSFFLIPKEGFEGLIELQEFRRLLREKIGK